MRIGWCAPLSPSRLVTEAASISPRFPGRRHRQGRSGSFAAALTASSYRGMVAAECGVRDMASDMRRSLTFLRRYWPS